MRWFRRRPAPAERLAAEMERTGQTTTRWFHIGTLCWWCRIDGMSGHWETGSEAEAIRVLLAELRRFPSRVQP